MTLALTQYNHYCALFARQDLVPTEATFTEASSVSAEQNCHNLNDSAEQQTRHYYEEIVL